MIETGVHFGDIHSFHDLNLILAPFTYAPAKVKKLYVDLPGGNGSVDMTGAFGEVKYEDREFKFTFTVAPWDTLTFEERQTAVSNALNGLKCNITLDKDPDYYWEGRCEVSEYLSNKKLRQIVILATVAPYKMAQHETVVTASLVESIAPGYAPFADIRLVNNGKKTVCPVVITTGAEMSVTKMSGSPLTTHVLTAGTHKLLDIQLATGEVTNVMVAGEGTITFTYREGVL